MAQVRKYKRIYQNVDGTYLLDTSQPNPDDDFEINSDKYTPHQSTRYMNVIIGNNGKAQHRNQLGLFVDVDKDLPELYANRENCCGCSACYSICPVQAVTMRPDEEGFLYPVVDAEMCIRCYQCISICAFKGEQKRKGYLNP